MWRKENPYALFGMKIGSATVGNSMEVSHKKQNYHMIVQSYFLGIY